MPLFNVASVTIPLSGTLSEIIAVKGPVAPGLLTPNITSCQLMLLGGFDQTSASFVPVWRSDGASRWAVNLGSGAAALQLDVALAFPFVRLETSVPVASAFAFQIVQKF